jgi:hypothetical protein
LNRQSLLRLVLALLLGGVGLQTSAVWAQDPLSGLSPWSMYRAPMSAMEPSGLSSTSFPSMGLPTPGQPSLGYPSLGYPSVSHPSLGYPSMSYPYAGALPSPSGMASPSSWQHYLDPWQAQPGAGTGSTLGRDYQPDLTGHWRGSAGETVEIRGNQARIWGGRYQSCDCHFWLVGKRLIAYSPESDVVRKYWFQGDRNRFSLIDEAGNVMVFRRSF